MSEQAWAEAWVKAWAEMPEIGQGHTVDVRKEGKKVFSYTYASLHDILAAVQPVLTKHGFAVSQSPTPEGIETHITHKDGYTKVYGPLPMPQSNDPKAIGSGITYGRRYALAAALGIATEEDTDAGGTDTPKEGPSPHDELWSKALSLFGDVPEPGPEKVFLDALADAGVPGGKRANKTQAAKAIKYMEAL